MKKQMARSDRSRIVKILITGILESLKAKNNGKYNKRNFKHKHTHTQLFRVEEITKSIDKLNGFARYQETDEETNQYVPRWIFRISLIM